MTEMEKLVQTSVTALTYDLSRRTGHLTLPLGCCTDMDGAITPFTTVAPQTCSGSKRVRAASGTRRMC